MRDLHIVMPMAGLGTRFTKAGVMIHKPLIQIAGRPMFMHAVDNFDQVGAILHYSFIIREEQNQEFDLGWHIKEELPEANIIVVDKPTKGPLVSAREALPYISEDEGVVVTYCDARIESPDYFAKIRESLSGIAHFNGALLLFAADNPAYGYAKISETGLITEIAEKRVISPYAIAAGCYVARKDILDRASQAVLDDSAYESHAELYVTDMFVKIMEAGGDVAGVVLEKTGRFEHFGTPDELAVYEKIISKHTQSDGA